MGAIEWILVTEAILLIVAGICGGTAYFSRPMNQPPDAFLRCMLGFWRVVGAWRPTFDAIGPDRSLIEPPEDEDDPTPRTAGAPELSEGDALAALGRAAADDRSDPAKTGARTAPRGKAAASPVLRGGDAPESVAVSTLSVQVVPRSPATTILGRHPSGLRLGIEGAADDALANKLVLAMVARELQVKPYQVTLVRGHFQTAKVVRVAGLAQEQMDRLLR